MIGKLNLFETWHGHGEQAANKAYPLTVLCDVFMCGCTKRGCSDLQLFIPRPAGASTLAVCLPG